jgi:hypothetical protein
MASLLLPREERIALAAFEAMFPNYEGSPLAIGAQDVDMRAFLLDVMATYPPRLRTGLRALFWLLDASALLVNGRSFSRLPPDIRERLLLRYYNSRIYYLRYVALMLKAVAALGFFGFPEVRERIGYLKNRNVSPVEVGGIHRSRLEDDEADP